MTLEIRHMQQEIINAFGVENCGVTEKARIAVGSETKLCEFRLKRNRRLCRAFFILGGVHFRFRIREKRVIKDALINGRWHFP